jgi:uncharacterized membrane protein
VQRSPEFLADQLLGRSLAQLDAEERKVIESIAARQALSRDTSDIADERSSFGERMADRVARIGGSWGFILAFTVVLLGWMLLNSEVLQKLGMAFDPYPFIFLNLMLSTLAAIQAPIIMMSQNRQASKDRIAADHDYQVNLRAELEIIRMHAKIDRLLEAIEPKDHGSP